MRAAATASATSKFNISEPNVRIPGPTSPVSRGSHNNYQNDTAAQQMQLKSMLAQPRGSTLDGPGQSAALQHLRSSGLGGPQWVAFEIWRAFFHLHFWEIPNGKKCQMNGRKYARSCLIFQILP